MSQKRKFLRSLPSGLGLGRSQFFRSGIVIQAALPLSSISMPSLRPLRSTVITRFPATMGLSDSRQGPTAGYLFPSAVFAPRGPPRFLCRSFHARCPLPPRRARRLLLPVASPPVPGFIILGQTGHSHPLRHEAEFGFACAAARVFASQGFASGITPTHACSATCRTGNLQDILLSEY
jgi:hypothetical protein